MSHERDPFMEAAVFIAQSDDPAAELLKLARRESSRRQRRTRIRVGAVAALLLAGVGALWLVLHSTTSPTAPETRTAFEDSHWMRDVRAKARDQKMSAADEARVRAFLHSDSGLLRRGAVITLGRYGLEIDPVVLDRVAFELAETIDHPVVVAALDGEHVSDALFTNHQATLRAVARAIWHHCARTHAYPRVKTIERLLWHPDSEIRKTCCKALAELTGYVPTAELRARIEADTIEVQRAARRLLDKGK